MGRNINASRQSRRGAKDLDAALLERVLDQGALFFDETGMMKRGTVFDATRQRMALIGGALESVLGFSGEASQMGFL